MNPHKRRDDPAAQGLLDGEGSDHEMDDLEPGGRTTHSPLNGSAKTTDTPAAHAAAASLASEKPDHSVPTGIRRYLSLGCQLYILAMFCGALMKASSKLLVERMNQFFVVLVRMSITFVVAILYMYIKGHKDYFWGPVGTRRLMFTRGFLGFINISCTCFSLKYLSLPDVAVLTFLNPLITGIMARIFLHESYTLQQGLFSLLSLSGVVLIARPTSLVGTTEDGEQPSDSTSPITVTPRLRLLAISATLLVVVLSGFVMIILRKIGKRAHALCSVSNYSFISVVGSFIILTSTRGQWEVPRQLWTWVLLIVTGASGFCLQFLTSTAIQMEEASVLVNFKYTSLIWSILLELIFWHDLPDIWSVFGGSLVMVGVVLSAIYKKRAAAAQEAAVATAPTTLSTVPVVPPGAGSNA